MLQIFQIKTNPQKCSYYSRNNDKWHLKILKNIGNSVINLKNIEMSKIGLNHANRIDFIFV